MLINIKKTFSSSTFLKALKKNLRAIMYIFLLQLVNVFLSISIYMRKEKNVPQCARMCLKIIINLPLC